MNECNYYIGDGPTKRVLPTPRTTAADFRKLAPLVLREALRQAGTVARLPADGPRPPGAAHSEDGRRMVCLARLGPATEMPLLDAELSLVTAMLERRSSLDYAYRSSCRSCCSRASAQSRRGGQDTAAGEPGRGPPSLPVWCCCGGSVPGLST